MTSAIWDEPEGRVVKTGAQKPERKLWLAHEHEPFHPSWSGMAWNPKAVKVDNIYLGGFDNEWNEHLAVLPKMPDHEATLFYDLLSRVFVFDPSERPTAREMLDHPWFHLDGLRN